MHVRWWSCPPAVTAVTAGATIFGVAVDGRRALHTARPHIRRRHADRRHCPRLFLVATEELGGGGVHVCARLRQTIADEQLCCLHLCTLGGVRCALLVSGDDMLVCTVCVEG